MKSKPDRIDLESYVSRHIVSAISKAAGVPLLMLQCMDYRYPRRTLETMDSLGLRGKYDQLILAGASLGVVHKPEWQTTFLDQLEFAINEHHVSQVLILDHRDCGAYRKFLGVTPDDPKHERDEHTKVANRAIGVILARFPQLKAVSCLLLPIETIEELVVWPEKP